MEIIVTILIIHILTIGVATFFIFVINNLSDVSEDCIMAKLYNVMLIVFAIGLLILMTTFCFSVAYSLINYLIQLL